MPDKALSPRREAYLLRLRRENRRVRIWQIALVAGLFLIEAVCCLYAVRSPEAVNVLTYGGRSACQYPIDIYPRPLRVLFVCVAPFALTTHAPAAYILEKPLLGLPGWAAYVVPLAGAAFLTLMYFVFRRALKDYRSTGS